MVNPAWAAPWTLTPLLAVEARGLPVPQGSIRSLGAGRPSVHSNAKTLLPWREAVQHAIESAVLASDRVPDNLRLTGPVALELVFTLPKPTSRPKRKRSWPDVRPDLDKLARCVLDALTNSGAIKDDGQVIHLELAKSYPLEHPNAMPTPGLRLRLSLIDPEPAVLHALDGGGIVDVPLPDLDQAPIPW